MRSPTAAWPRITFVTACSILVLFEWARLIPGPRNDFINHYHSAELLYHHQFLYEHGLNFVYPPFWAMFHGPFTLVSLRAAMLIAFPLGFAAIVALFAVLCALAQPHWPLHGSELFWCTAAVIFIALAPLQRDLEEVGANSFLVLLSWLGICLWMRRRDVSAGAAIGLAAALKCTPILFIGYFAWKRQWKITLASLAALALFTTAPMLITGPAEFFRDIHYWADNLKRGISDPDPSEGVLGQEKIENLALRPALARYLMHLPYGHLGRPESSDDATRPNGPPDPLYLQFLNLSPKTAGQVARVIMLFGALPILWITRHPARDRTDAAILWECAAVSLAMLLYSPVTWQQHCVGAVPAIYFLCRAKAAGQPVPKFSLFALAFFAISFTVLQRGLITLRFSKLVDAYRFKTVANALLLIAVCQMTLLCRRRKSPIHPNE
jgi:alpha-1,2-mannosyltransferase